MNRKSRTAAASAITTVGILLLAVFDLAAQSNPARPAAAATPTSTPAATAKTTDEAFKNIQVLKGVPADQLIPAMQFITSSLGVECDFCHVQGAFEKDDKAPKQTARKMMKMMFAINQENFNGEREVTCYSCHRGAEHPVGTPFIDGENANGEETSGAGSASHAGHDSAPAAADSSRPADDQIIQNYIRALGGADAIQKISSRVQHGTVNFGDRSLPIDIFSQGPDKRAADMHTPAGESTTIYDGHSGWLGSPSRPPRELSGADLDFARMDADLYFPLHIKQIFSELGSAGSAKIGDRETYVVSASRAGQPPVRFYFDQQSGLLLRILRFTETPLGRNPTRIDYADYRDAGGAKTPFRWTISRPSGGFTVQVEQSQENVTVDPAKFSKPAAEGSPPSHP